MSLLKKINKIVTSGQTIESLRSGKIKRYIIQRLADNVLIGFLKALCKAKYINDRKMQTYSMKDLDSGFRMNKDNTNNHIKDTEINRTIEAYSRSQDDQPLQPEEYQIGGMWAPILEECHKDLKNVLRNKDVTGLKKILDNFGVDKISRGLSLSGGLPRNIREKMEWFNAFNLSRYNWSILTDLGENPAGYCKEIGNLPGIKKNGEVILMPSFRLSYFAARIYDLLFPKKDAVVVEIGGGYGGIPYHLLKEHADASGMTYMDFDIPEICVVSSYFLMSNFPDKKFLLYGEQDLEKAQLKDYDIIVMPNFAIKDMPEESCDLVFNSHSMVEMDAPTVKEYLKQISRISTGYFLHVNREYGPDATFTTLDGQVKNHICINCDEFELPNENFKRVYRMPEIIQNESNVNADCLYFEYLYERIKSINGSR